MLNSCSYLIHVILYKEAGKQALRNHRSLDPESTLEIAESSIPFVLKETEAQETQHLIQTHKDQFKKGLKVNFGI